MSRTFIFCLLLIAGGAMAQPARYTIANTHSHNDYEQSIPFWLAYNEGFGSIEADIFLKKGVLLVGHDTVEIKAGRTLEEYYIRPLLSGIQKHNGYPYADTSRSLQMLIDIKTDSIATVDSLIALLERYPALTGNASIRWVLTGNRPSSSLWSGYPSFISFDGILSRDYEQEALHRIVMMSDDLKEYTHWNGKGNMTEPDRDKVAKAIARSHRLGKPVRFWDAPDFINAWEQLMKLGVDYINTDHIQALGAFLKKLPASSFISDTGKLSGHTYSLYKPTYKSDGIDKPAKNVILLIGDGTGLAQLYAGYTANKGALNVFQMNNIGLSKTSSYDNYVTDSAPGSTAFSSGEKTNNRYVGVDHAAAPLRLLPAILQKKRIKTGLVTCGFIADATPADFYAHQTERDNVAGVLMDLKGAPIDLLMGSGHESIDNVDILKSGAGVPAFNEEKVLRELQPEYTITRAVDSVPEGNSGGKKWIVMEKRAGSSMLKGRGDWLQKACMKSVAILSRNKPGFFLMTEGAQVDYGGHVNNLPYVATEVMDFDQVIGKALQFADEDGETLVIVTADHETGGLSLLDGNYGKGYVMGQFSTNDHTAIPVPVFAYGPRSGLFRGVYENTAIFSKILRVYGL